jgi:hypothetical protein
MGFYHAQLCRYYTEFGADQVHAVLICWAATCRHGCRGEACLARGGVSRRIWGRA